MKTVSERMLEYVRFNTQSNGSTGRHPSTPGQLEFARHLAKELRELGVERVRVSEFAYVFGEIPPSADCGEAPALGLVAHMDTSADAPGDNVRPQLVEYRGGVIPLGDSGRTLDPAVFPELNRLTGHTLITTDGTTLLGADDKAGIAEIMTALENILAANAPHGKLCIAFTPDEEIGAGVDHFDVAKFGADCAYTLDGGEEGEIAYETFNACSAELHFDGLSVHPGSSKDTMINAALVAMEYNALLPAGDIPRLTEGYEGFFHLCDMKGDVEHAELHYIVRDHDRATFEARKKLMEHAVKVINEKYGRSVVTLRLKDSYYNMAEKLTDHMELIENAKRACEAAGMKPFIEAVRGGTDGCRLSYMGLPTPNLCTGGFAFHGPYEHIAAESMDRCTKMVELLMIGE